MALKRLCWTRLLLFFALLLMCLCAEGCMGWGDMFAPKHLISSDYSLMQGEEDSNPDVYLMVKEASIEEQSSGTYR
jgi:hypothetical protein